MKELTLFLIYAIGRNELDFWTQMEYSEAWEQVNLCWNDFAKWKAHQTKEMKADHENLVRRYMFSHVPDEVKI